MSDANPAPPDHLTRWLRFLKLLLGVVVSVLTIARLLGWL